MADRSAIEEIRWALEWMQRHAPFMSGPGHVTDREDAAILAKRALARLDELPTPETIAKAGANGYELGLLVGSEQTAEASALVRVAAGEAIAEAERRGYEKGRSDGLRDTLADVMAYLGSECQKGRSAGQALVGIGFAAHVGAAERAKEST